MSNDPSSINHELVAVLMGPAVTREKQKVKRLSFTDFIRDAVVPYYQDKGSKNYDKIYQVYSKLIKCMLFEISDGYEKKYLEFLSPEQIKLLVHVESMTAIFIDQGMSNGLGYKDLYQFVKRELSDLGIPKTPVPYRNYIVISGMQQLLIGDGSNSPEV